MALPRTDADLATPAYIAKIRADVETGETELQSVLNEIANYDPKRLEMLRADVKHLTARAAKLVDALFVILVRAHQPRSGEEYELRAALLRKALMDFCIENGVDKKVWQDAIKGTDEESELEAEEEEKATAARMKKASRKGGTARKGDLADLDDD